ECRRNVVQALVDELEMRRVESNYQRSHFARRYKESFCEHLRRLDDGKRLLGVKDAKLPPEGAYLLEDVVTVRHDRQQPLLVFEQSRPGYAVDNNTLVIHSPVYVVRGQRDYFHLVTGFFEPKRKIMNKRSNSAPSGVWGKLS